MSRMVEVVIDSVRVSLTNQQRIVVLREVDSERYLSIWIGPYEAEAITIALQEVEVARPQTHDLLKNTIAQLNARLLRVEIISLKDDVFFGNLVVDQDGNILNVDSRPSDALALAVRCHVPVLIAKEVMDAAGVLPDENIEDGGQPSKGRKPLAEKPPEPPAGEGDPDAEGRLSVFEDFLSNLNMDDLAGDEPNEDDKPDEGKPKRKK